MRARIGLITLALMLLPAASASAQADYTANLSAENPKFTWESVGSGAPALIGPLACAGAVWHCEHVLFNIAAGGTLQLTLDSTEGVEGPAIEGEPIASYQDLDGYLYKSNAAGEAEGDALTDGDVPPEQDCVTSFPSETCQVKVEPGYYLFEIDFFAALEAPYIGTGELLGAAATAAAPPPPAPPAPQPTPDPPAQPQPQPQPQSQQPSTQSKKKRKSAAARRKACTKKAKKTKNKRKRARAIKRCKRIK